MYQEFSDEQVADLEDFVQSAEFGALKRLPPWQRAYRVAQHLGQAGTEATFGLLLSSLWFDTENFLADDELIDTFLSEANEELLRVEVEDKPFVQAIAGYALSAAGRHDEANQLFSSAAEAKDAPDYLLKYISAVKACQSNMKQDGCRPYDRFEPGS